MESSVASVSPELKTKTKPLPTNVKSKNKKSSVESDSSESKKKTKPLSTNVKFKTPKSSFESDSSESNKITKPLSTDVKSKKKKSSESSDSTESKKKIKALGRKISAKHFPKRQSTLSYLTQTTYTSVSSGSSDRSSFSSDRSSGSYKSFGKLSKPEIKVPEGFIESHTPTSVQRKDSNKSIRSTKAQRYIQLKSHLRELIKADPKTDSFKTVNQSKPDTKVPTLVIKSPTSTSKQRKEPLQSIQKPKQDTLKKRFTLSETRLQGLFRKVDSKYGGKSFRLDNEDVEENRPQWYSNMDFRFVVVSYVIGTGNFITFPQLVNKHGGIFCLVYIIMYLLFAYSLVLMEYAWGQFCSRGPGACWEFAKLFQGVGYLMILLNFIYMVPYSTNAAWFFYLLTSGDCPWLTSPDNQNHLYKLAVKSFNTTDETLEDIGTIQGSIVLSNFFIWSMAAVFLLSGIMVMGRIAVCTFLCGTVLFLILLFKGLTLPGASKSINHVFSLHSFDIIDFHMWIDAGHHLIFSMDLSVGVHLTFSSYNHFNNQITDDALATTLGDILASFLGVLFHFAYLGYLTDGDLPSLHQFSNTPPDELLFVTLPTAIAKFPSPRSWIVLYIVFFMGLIYLRCAFMTEVIITGVIDTFHLRLRHRKYVVLAVCLTSFIASLLMSTEKGFDVSNMILYFSGRFIEIAVAILNVLTISWIYGVNRFIFQTECMVGWETSMMLSLPFMKKWWAWCWKYITPGTLMIILAREFAGFLKDDSIDYAIWAKFTGTIIVMTMLTTVVVSMSVQLWKAEDESLHDRFIYLTTPLPSWQPQYPPHRRIVDMGKQLDEIEANRRQTLRVTRFEDLKM